MATLAGKIAVVTGGSSGIGFASAKRFISEGAKVVITGRNEQTLNNAVAALGDQALGIVSDVAKLEDLDRLYTTIQQRFERIDILFANAGVAPMAPFEHVTIEDFDKLFDINVRGLFFSVQKTLPLLKHGSSIVLNASVVAQKGFPNTSVYSATKAAVRSLGRTLANELAPRGIRVNVVSPGLTETPFWGKVGLNHSDVKDFEAAVVQQTPLSRTGKPEEIAAAVAFLASGEASFITGADIVVDGGQIQV